MLQESIGLHSRSIGDASITRAIQKRMKACKINTDAEYLALLRSNTNEFSELVEEVVVPETWFFRNTSPFDALAGYIPGLSVNKRGDSSTPLKILSIPCSSGEEPYSIAMVLMERGLARSEFSIDAFDISQRALRKARQAVYGENSFREQYRGLRQKYFRETSQGFSLIDDVKEQVRFKQGNIIKDSFAGYLASYDVIFCRNLLIYFGRETQSLVLDKLYRLLKVGGVLCVGHAEASQVPKKCFLSLDIPMAFAFRKIESDESPDTTSFLLKFNDVDFKRKESLKNLAGTYKDLVGVVENNRRISNEMSHKTKKDVRGKKSDHLYNKAIPHGVSTVDIKPSEGMGDAVNFDLISELIEKGRLQDAADIAEQYLKSKPESSEAYYYLGLISHLEGGGNAAESLLKKAIYLDPHQHAAIGLLVLLADERGDTQQADAYRRRQKRAIQHRSKDNGSVL